MTARNGENPTHCSKRTVWAPRTSASAVAAAAADTLGNQSLSGLASRTGGYDVATVLGLAIYRGHMCYFMCLCIHGEPFSYGESVCSAATAAWICLSAIAACGLTDKA